MFVGRAGKAGRRPIAPSNVLGGLVRKDPGIRFRFDETPKCAATGDKG